MKEKVVRHIKGIFPSLLSADPLSLGNDLMQLEKAGADGVHLDIMDGHFVPNLTFGPKIAEAVCSGTVLPIDAHLMVSHPSHFIKRFLEAGVNHLTFHAEVKEDIPALLTQIRAAGVGAGLALRPCSPLEKILPYLPLLDHILIMTVEPGFGGQSFLHDQLPKIQNCQTLIDKSSRDKSPCVIQVDGGIDIHTIPLCAAAGAQSFVAGTSAFKDKRLAENIAALKKAASSSAASLFQKSQHHEVHPQ